MDAWHRSHGSARFDKASFGAIAKRAKYKPCAKCSARFKHRFYIKHGANGQLLSEKQERFAPYPISGCSPPSSPLREVASESEESEQWELYWELWE